MAFLHNIGDGLRGLLQTYLATGGLSLTLLFIAVFFGVVAIFWYMGASNNTARRLSGISPHGHVIKDRESLSYRDQEGFWNDLVKMLEVRLPLVDEAKRPVVKQRLLQAGYFHPSAVRNYFVIRLLLVLSLPAIVILMAPYLSRDYDIRHILLFAMMLSVLGLYLPSVWVTQRIATRQREVSEAFPDAVDMLVVCVEAGLALDAAFNRVGTQLGRAHAALATHFAWVALELRAGKSREDALRNMSTRIGVPEINSFVMLLIQSDQLGTSIAQTLRVHSEEMRAKRTLRAEEKAHKLPVKLAVPLVLFILPAICAVALLPAIIKIVRELFPILTGT